jgi:hypothetical protein
MSALNFGSSLKNKDEDRETKEMLSIYFGTNSLLIPHTHRTRMKEEAHTEFSLLYFEPFPSSSIIPWKKYVSRNPGNDKKEFCSDFLFFMYVIQHCFICRPSDSNVS